MRASSSMIPPKRNRGNAIATGVRGKYPFGLPDLSQWTGIGEGKRSANSSSAIAGSSSSRYGPRTRNFIEALRVVRESGTPFRRALQSERNGFLRIAKRQAFPPHRRRGPPGPEHTDARPREALRERGASRRALGRHAKREV